MPDIVATGTVRLTNLADARGSIDKLIKEAVQKAILVALGPVKAKVSILLAETLESSTEWKEILGGTLQQEFGLRDPAEELNLISEALANSVAVEKVNPPNSIGGMLVTILPFDVQRRLAANIAYRSRGGRVDWLNWMLFSGKKIVIGDARLQLFSRSVEKSRAGYALMVKSKPLGYAVSPEFAGTEGANWFTKVLTEIGFPVLEIMIEEVKRSL